MSLAKIFVASFAAVIIYFIGANFALWAQEEKNPTTTVKGDRQASRRKGQCHYFNPGALSILPQDGRKIYLEAFAQAQEEVRIEICVLEDPEILRGLQRALKRGVVVRVIVDKDKYESTSAERKNLKKYLTKAGGKLHLSNPIFPRSFPKVILIDRRYALIGSACLDTTTFVAYRDYVYVTDACAIIKALSKLFENEWHFSAKPGHQPATFNPTPKIKPPNLLVSPVNATALLVSLIQRTSKTLAITTELLGNPTLESELAAAVARGVSVRLIAPQIVNDATVEEQLLQHISLQKLQAAGIHVHVTRHPESAQCPYMHARTAIFDKKEAYVGSISLSPNSTTFNREVGILLDDKNVIEKLLYQFEIDYTLKSHLFQYGLEFGVGTFPNPSSEYIERVAPLQGFF